MNNLKPLVSIIIPVYNGSNYLAQAIDSAIAQTYENIEIIVVNDGSVDDGATEKIALSYGNKIRYFYKENGGCATAINYGISKMNGEFFSWLSHDDLYLPEKVEKEMNCITQNNLNYNNTIISCSAGIIDVNGNEMFYPKKNKKHFYKSPEIYNYFFLSGTLNGCGLLIPKRAFDIVGTFSTEYKYILDWELWIKFALNGFDFYTIDDKLVKNRVHNQQVTIQHSSILMKETKTFITDLTIQLLKKKYEHIYIKPVYYFCRSLGFTSEAQKLKQYLKEIGEFKISTMFKGEYNSLKKRILRFLKKIYNYIIRK